VHKAARNDTTTTSTSCRLRNIRERIFLHQTTENIYLDATLKAYSLAYWQESTCVSVLFVLLPVFVRLSAPCRSRARPRTSPLGSQTSCVTEVTLPTQLIIPKASPYVRTYCREQNQFSCLPLMRSAMMRRVFYTERASVLQPRREEHLKELDKIAIIFLC
jgi:hypothetical protein